MPAAAAVDSAADTRLARRDQTARRSEARVQATRIRPDTGPTDRRRLAAAGLSAVLPGLGQAVQPPAPAGGPLPRPLAGPPRASALLARPDASRRPGSPRGSSRRRSSGTLLTLNAARCSPGGCVAVGQAFLDTRRHGPTGRLGIIGHRRHRARSSSSRTLVVYRYGTAPRRHVRARSSPAQVLGADRRREPPRRPGPERRRADQRPARRRGQDRRSGRRP